MRLVEEVARKGRDFVSCGASYPTHHRQPARENTMWQDIKDAFSEVVTDIIDFIPNLLAALVLL